MKTTEKEWIPSLTNVSRYLRANRVNLGAGLRPDLSGTWRNQDLHPGPNIDDVFDLNGTWPYPSGGTDDLYACHVLEHLKDPVHFISECQRVLKPDGHVLIRVPYGAHWAWGWDPTHLKPFFLQTFLSFSPVASSMTYNLQEEQEEFPSKFAVDEIRMVVADEITKLPLWKWWVPKYGQYFWNIVTEIWCRLHRLSDADAIAWKKGGLNHAASVVYMNQNQSLTYEPICTWQRTTGGTHARSR